ncbi:MAG: formylglycine-generating enzyme family protein [Kiritimatiellia bacterium]
MTGLLKFALLAFGLSSSGWLAAGGVGTNPPAGNPSIISVAELTLDLGNNVSMKLARIPAGKFVMGCPASEKDAEWHAHPADEAQHEVAISNAWEWCADWYAANYGASGSQTNPAGPATGSIRVLRGGSWNYCSYGLRQSGRGRIGPTGQYDVNGGGFRVVVVEGGARREQGKAAGNREP